MKQKAFELTWLNQCELMARDFQVKEINAKEKGNIS